MPRERRHKSRSRRRRGRFGALYKFIAVVLVALAIVVACAVFFRVNQITVTGNYNYTEETIIEVSGIETGDNLVVLPKNKIASRILTGLPYIRSVTIQRQFPDGILLTVAEHQAAAAVSDGYSWWYISAQGKLLEEVDVPEQAMTISGLTAVSPRAGEKLTVEDSESTKLDHVLSLLSVLEDRDILGDCTSLDCSGTNTLVLRYLGFEMKMPSSDDFSYDFLLLEGALESGRISRTDSGTCDFTVAQGKMYFTAS